MKASIHRLLDYCNAVLAERADILMKQLQSVQTTVDCSASGARRRDHITEILQSPLVAGVAKNRFQDHNHAYTYVNSVCQLKMS